MCDYTYNYKYYIRFNEHLLVHLGDIVAMCKDNHRSIKIILRQDVKIPIIANYPDTATRDEKFESIIKDIGK